MKTKIRLSLFLPTISAVMFLLNACSTTHFLENWSDPDYKGPALSKILVIGIINTEDKRRMFEDQFTKLLSTQDRTGIASYTLIPHLDKSVNKEVILSAVENSGADGVLIVTTHGVIKLLVSVLIIYRIWVVIMVCTDTIICLIPLFTLNVIL